MNNEFIFLDESGTKKQDRFFVAGFLKLKHPDNSFRTLSIHRDKLFGISRMERLKRVELLYKNNELEELMALSKTPFKFELKYSKINVNNLEIYKRFVADMLKMNIH